MMEQMEAEYNIEHTTMMTARADAEVACLWQIAQKIDASPVVGREAR